MERQTNEELVIPITAIKEVLSVPMAFYLRDNLLYTARFYGISGAVSVYNNYYEICSQLTDEEANPGSLSIARGKIKTVLQSGRSTNQQKQRMIERGYDRADYMGDMGSLFGGGAAIFKDEALRLRIGALAFSGGTQEEDQDICTIAISDVGLYTDNTLRNVLRKQN